MGEAPYVVVGTQFLGHYYNLMQNNRASLAALYHHQSCMSFEGSHLHGRDAIMQKLTSLPFKSVQYSVTTQDAQPVFEVDGGEAVFISVMGQLKTDDDPPQSFTHSFFLRKSEGNYYIANETFRLVVHNSV